jgi:hypothetical protein
LKYYAKCLKNGEFLNLSTKAESEEQAITNITDMYKVEKVIEVSLIPFTRKQVFTKFKVS